MDTDKILTLSTINNLHVNQHSFQVDAPLLLDAQTLTPIDYPKIPFQIESYKSFDECSASIKSDMLKAASYYFMQPTQDYLTYQEDFLAPQILTPQNCDNPIIIGQHSLFAKKSIKQYQFLGFYSGIYAKSFDDLQIIFEKFDPLLVGRYGNGCRKEGIPVICGHYNGNYMSIVNDWRPFEWYAQSNEACQKIKNKALNAYSIVVKSGAYYFIAYFSTQEIKAGTQIMTDYGVSYWEREKEIIDQLSNFNDHSSQK